MKNPANKWLATVGFGISTPNVSTNEITIDARGVDQDETPLGGDGPPDATLFTFSAKVGGGLKQWASLPGQRCSSTRVETAAAIISLICSKAIHMGTDSAAMMCKARKLQTAAVNWMESVVNNWRPSRNPVGKPWGL